MKVDNNNSTLLVTGSCGLIGSGCVEFLQSRFKKVIGVDNNMRQDFFGPSGDTSAVRQGLEKDHSNYEHLEFDIRDRGKITALFKSHRPAAIIHCAAQPSHDLSASRPFDDFEVNVLGTMNLLESARRYCAESPFIFLSTNKVYGERPNSLPLHELETRFDYSDAQDYFGIREEMPIDQTRHSLFGASKASADILVQEYGRYFSMPTICLRGGCLTGARHAGVELHGFLSYLIKTALRGGEYRILGFKGKQVRDQIDSSDVAAAIWEIICAPRCGEVYNIGGGRQNSASLMECLKILEERFALTLKTTYIDQSRVGDHICYISDTRKFSSHYPNWQLRMSLDNIFDSMVSAQRAEELRTRGTQHRLDGR